MRVSADFELLPEPETLLETIRQWFGMPASTFDGHRFWYRKGARAVWIAAKDALPPNDLRLDAFGMLVSRNKSGFKPTSVFIQRFGHAAVGRRVVLSEAQVELFLRRVAQPAVEDLSPGLVIVFEPGGAVLGCGRIKDGQLLSELPKSWTMAWK